MIKLENIHKYFYKNQEKEVHALNNINLEFKDSEFTLLSGASGCGKTTLLNIIGALDTIDSGKIYHDNIDISSLSEKKKTKFRLDNIGFVFQAYNLIPVLTVYENIGFIMKLRGFADIDINTRVLEIASMLEIDNKLNSLPSELSGGQQQRVAVARAVATKPKIILADEPTANLDSINSKKLMDMMKDLNEKENISIIFASHDNYIKQNVKRVVKLSDGVVIEEY